MTEKVTVSCQIPANWNEKIARLAAERKKEVSQIIYEALAQYLGEDIAATDIRLLTLQSEVLMLQKQLTELSTTVKKVQQRLPSLTSIISVYEPDALKFTQKNQEVLPLEEEEFLGDEPDEILYDFLPPEERQFR